MSLMILAMGLLPAALGMAGRAREDVSKVGGCV